MKLLGQVNEQASNKNSRVLGQYFSSMCFCHSISFGFHPAIHSEAKWNCLKLDEIKWILLKSILAHQNGAFELGYVVYWEYHSALYS